MPVSLAIAGTEPVQPICTSTRERQFLRALGFNEGHTRHPIAAYLDYRNNYLSVRNLGEADLGRERELLARCVFDHPDAWPVCRATPANLFTWSDRRVTAPLLPPGARPARSWMPCSQWLNGPCRVSAMRREFSRHHRRA